ncbi:MAG: ACT domain-containing protein, partial [Planctomycetota bacterium]|nr:ACT domain-containing protein [Planctomycetota bacterium]
PVLAQQRGIEVEQIISAKSREFANLMEVKLVTDSGTRTAAGTIFGHKFPRIISIDGYRMEMKPEGNVVIIFNKDKPGVLGRYGTIFGSNSINIADMTFSRKVKKGLAVVGINLDQAPTEKIMNEIRAIDYVTGAYYLELPALPAEQEDE